VLCGNSLREPVGAYGVCALEFFSFFFFAG